MSAFTHAAVVSGLELRQEKGLFAEPFARIALTESLPSKLMLPESRAGTKGLSVSDVQCIFWGVRHALDAAGI